METSPSTSILERLSPLSDALLDRKSARFRYRGIHRGEPTDREVQPYGLFFQRGNWYLVGRDLTRDGTRVFRIDRIEALEINTRSPNTHDYSIPDDFRLADHLERKAWELGDEPPVEARVLFRFPLSRWAGREGGDVVRVFPVRQVQPFLRWLLGFAGEAEIVAPAELDGEFRRLGRDVARLYAEMR